jgi:hypothetical protein
MLACRQRHQSGYLLIEILSIFKPGQLPAI